MLTDAGSPGVADPGVTAVRAAVAADANVTAVPGPSAVTMALGISGFGGDRFVFEGFLPRKGKARRARIEALASETRTAVLFCAPGRLAGDLGDLAAELGDRGVVVCREMTKLHEEVWRGTLPEAAVHWAETTARGEVTVVVEGGEAPAVDLVEAVRLVEEAVRSGESPSAAVRRVAAETGVGRRALYQAVISG